MRLYVGQFTDFDESLTFGEPLPTVTDKWIRLSHRRAFILYLIDILIFIFAFSFIYFGLNYCCNGKGFAGVYNQIGFRQWIDFIYFTLVTFTTTGFGDILPNSDFIWDIWVKIMVGMQMFLGFLYVVGLIQYLPSHAKS